MKYADTGINLKNLNDLKKSILSNYDVLLKGHYSPIIPYKKNTYFSIHVDGVGTKTIIAEKLNQWDTIGFDAVAMNVNDMCCINCKPIIAVDYIACREQNNEIIEKIIKSITTACKKANIKLVGGETAILPDLLNGYDISVTTFGIGKINNVITGKNLKGNEIIIGLKSSGLHSNGYSLARKVLDIEKYGKELLKPTIIYSNYVLELCKTVNVKGIAHITGGAFSKIKRLNNTIDFYLENMPEPFGIFKPLVEIINDEKELYSVFNMGIGMIVVVENENEVKKAINLAKKHELIAMQIGYTRPGTGIINIKTFNGNKIEL
ncbi:MAG: phosphoribosylformylglycinamidine cyclo-ligase [Candidatus Anstonellales archaeon]